MSTDVLKKLPKEELVDYLVGVKDVAVNLLCTSSSREMLDVVVDTAMHFLKADGGSLYLHSRPGYLDFEFCLNRSFELEFNPSEIPLTTDSIATYSFNNNESLNIEDVYLLGPEHPYVFNKSLDKHVGYRTKSTLATPLLDGDGKPVGVLQLFNRKNFQKEQWPQADEESLISEMPAFTSVDIELIKIFAAIASAAVLPYLEKDAKKVA